MEDDLPPPPDVSGVSLSGDSTLEISAEENAVLCRSTGVEPAADGSAHPIYFYIATQLGMGKTVAGLCAACDFDLADGPMMGGSRVLFSTPIMTGTPYRVEGEIKGLTRKRSRKMGVMDIMEYELRLMSADGATVVAVTSTWALPRRELT